MTSEAIVVVAVAVLGVLVWVVRLRVAMRRQPQVAGDNAPDISIIVPARNEAHNLPALLESLARMHPPPREVIVVDDHSTDGTGDIARGAGARVVVPPPLPENWNGKPWACWHGAAAATGSHLLFTDADTTHGADSLARASAELVRRRADLLSVIPTHTVVKMWERFQGVFHLLLLVATGAGAKTTRGERRFTIGQYILMSREAYDEIGGHGAVAGRVAEDLGLGRAVADTGRIVTTLFSPGLMRVRMYPEGLSSFLGGWRRSFYEGLTSAGVVASLEIAAVMGWLVGGPLFAVTAAFGGDLTGVLVGLVIYASATVAIARWQRGCGDFRAWTAPAYPLFTLVFTLISLGALFDRLRRAKVMWKGREVITQ